MKFIIFVNCLIAFTLVESYIYPVPLQQLQTPLLVLKTQQEPRLQQYFTQDTLGQYSYGYKEPLSTKQEVRTLDGVTSGSYSYIDANGLLQTVDYRADDEGFHVAATNLPKASNAGPKPVEETPEVAAAREQHLAAHKAILQGNPSASPILPKPVEDTTEVAEAKREFFARYAAEQELQKFLQKSALLRSQNLFGVTTITPEKSPLTVLKSQPNTSINKDVNSGSSSKAILTPSLGGFTYGYHIGAVKPSRYYLPVA